MKIHQGIAGLAKAGLIRAGIPVDKAPQEEVARRRDVCRECPHATRNPARLDRPSKGLTSLSTCGRMIRPAKGTCGCVIAAKTLLASASCPLGKWGPWKQGE